MGFVVEGRVVALRPVEVYSADYALREYGISDEQAERAFELVKADVRTARRARQTKVFTGRL